MSFVGVIEFQWKFIYFERIFFVDWCHFVPSKKIQITYFANTKLFDIYVICYDKKKKKMKSKCTEKHYENKFYKNNKFLLSEFWDWHKIFIHKELKVANWNFDFIILNTSIFNFVYWTVIFQKCKCSLYVLRIPNRFLNVRIAIVSSEQIRWQWSNSSSSSS